MALGVVVLGQGAARLVGVPFGVLVLEQSPGLDGVALGVVVIGERVAAEAVAFGVLVLGEGAARPGDVALGVLVLGGGGELEAVSFGALLVGKNVAAEAVRLDVAERAVVGVGAVPVDGVLLVVNGGLRVSGVKLLMASA